VEERTLSISGLRAKALFYARHRGLRQRVITPMTFNALVLVINLMTGIIVARTLGPGGRGEVAAILVLIFTASWIFSLGSQNALSYRLSRSPEEAATLIGSWLVVGVLASLAAIAAAEILLPVLFAAQSGRTVMLAQLYMPVIIFTLFINVFNGILLGDEDFLGYNVTRTLLPVIILLVYSGFLVTGAFSVETALIANALATIIACTVIITRCIRRHGVEVPRVSLMRETIWYGLQAHGGSLAGFVNARLDLLIIPAFLSAANVGLYSVATNAGSIVGTLVGTVSAFVLPVAVRRRKKSPRTVIRTFQATLAVGFVIAIPLAAFAEIAIELIYGSDFAGAVTPLRILLPGEVLDAAYLVLWAGLFAANKPILTSVAAVPGAVFTVVGLVLFLTADGIVAAATVTTIAYLLVFLLSVALYRHAYKLQWRDFIWAPTR
jgi:O-antigen/teichoic acid export membrane protein